MAGEHMTGGLANSWASRAARRPAGALATIAAAVSLAACGQHADQVGSPNAAGLIPIRVAGAEGINSATPFFVAQQQGFFKDAGLDVSYVTLSGGAAAMAAALKANQLDVALGAASQWMSDQAQGVVSGKIIGEFTDNNYVILGGKGITDVRQLKGKAFAIASRNSGDHLYSEAVLSHYGIAPADVNWLPLGDPATRLGAMMAGRVDGTEMTLSTLPASAKDRVLVSADDSPVPFVSNAIFANDTLLTRNKPALQKFLAAIGKASDWIKAHPDAAIPACQVSGSDVAGCKIAIQVGTTTKNPYTWSSTTKVNTAAIQSMIPIVAAAAPQAKALTVGDIVDTTVASGGS
ncbi:MAG TPA: ABC transporter substrate-binding protein [Caulobacteraceae bacterium]|nr:ABC transporter substrate-binding protein [Caulobacteraceae bacterium]